jgi:NADPH:quinone reductase-like Zn-dependent oxidoreductase
MRAMVVRRYGPPEVFEARDMPDPQPKPGEVVIRAKSIGVNFADLLQRMGLYPGASKPPFVPGLEIAGVVEKVAEQHGTGTNDAEQVKIGDAVAALTPSGAYAEWISVPARSVYRLPRGMTFEDGAALPVNYLTAYHSLFTMGNLQPGNRVLIHGAAGGVGIAAVQLARGRGLVTFGTAGRAKQEFLRRMGVDHAIDYEKSDFVGVVRKFAADGIEMVMDPIGGKSFARSAECLGPMGRLVVYGFSAAVGPDGKKNLVRAGKALLQTPRFQPLKLMARNIAVIGVSIGNMRSRGAVLRGELSELFQMYSAGKIKPVIAKTFPLAEVAAAHRYIHDRKNIGKVILMVK